MPTTTIQPNDARTVEGDNVQDTDDILTYREGFNDNHSKHIGFQFTIPNTIDPDDIETVEFRFNVQNGLSSWTFDMPLRIPRYEVTTLGTGSNQPMAIYDAATGSTEVTVDQAVPGSGWIDWVELTAADLIAAINSNADHSTTGTEIAIVNHAQASGNYNANIWGDDAAGATYPPELRITEAAPADFTSEPDVTPETDEAELPGISLSEDIDCTGVSAASGKGIESYRFIDVYPARGGTQPAGGWPCVVFVHGGRWVEGNKSLGVTENYLSRDLVDRLTTNGYVVASVEYRKMQESINPGSIFRSFPQNVHDVLAGIEYLVTNASDYDIDTTKLIYSGMSAGGHLALIAGVAAATNDTATYTGSQNNAGDRDAGYGYTDDQSPWEFDFDESGELSYTAPAGILLWDAPVDVWELTTMAGLTGDAHESAACALLGETTFNASSANDDEINANDYIAGTGNRFTSAKSAGDLPPICFMYSTTEDLVENDASINALETALDAISYDTSTGAGVLNTSGGLTKHGVAEDHADVLRNSDLDDEMAWLAQVTADTAPPLSFGDTDVEGIAVGDAEVVGLAVGASSLWP